MTRIGMIAFIIVLLAFLGGGYVLGAFFPVGTSHVPATSSVPVETASTTTEILVEDLSMETDFAVIHAEVPQFPSLDRAFNDRIKKTVTDAIAAHTTSSEENWNARAQTSGGSIPPVPPKEQRFPFFASWEAKQVNARYVSVLVRWGGFNGGAHGDEHIDTFNYDVARGMDMPTLDGLFPGESEYLTLVASTSIASLQSSIPDMMRTELDDTLRASIEEGAAPKKENYTRFTFTDDAITIYFAQYQVGPYVIGMPTVTIRRHE